MIRLETARDVRTWHGQQSGTIGLVPTMGALHAGHLSLVRRAVAECDRVIASIFVNPTQFDRADDLEHYPRDLEGDLARLAEGGCDAVFAPTAAEMYPPGFDTWVVPGAIATRLEGAARPGHFRGVCTIVLKLLMITSTDRAYFGRKDAQQLAVIQRMVRDLDVPTRIVPCETVREPDGLAMSSRNARLTPEDRAAAPVLYRALSDGRDALEGGETDAEALRARVRRPIEATPRARIDYVSVADPTTLQELDQIEDRALLSLAVWFSEVRLIDNLVAERGGSARSTVTTPETETRDGVR